MKRYEKYKSSGINWIGEIPSHWEEIKLKYIGYLYSGLTGKNGDDFKQKGNPENKSFIPFTNIANNIKIDPNKLEQVVMKKDDNQNKVLKGDLFFMMSSENIDDVGKSTILFDDIGEVYLNSFCKGFRVRDKNVNPLFLNYLLHNDAYRRRMMIEANGFTRINLKMEKVNDFFVSLPPKAEQTAIANFLDEKTAQIDKLISNKQKLIELLKEERTAIINEVVSGKGKKWERKKLKYVANIVLGKMLTNEDKGDFFLKPYLRAANMQWLTVDVSNVKEMWFSSNELVKLRIKKDDLLVSEGGEVGRTCIWQDELEECYIQNSVHKISFNKNLNPYFFLYYFFYLGSIGYFESVVNKISIGHLTCEKLNEVSVSYPNLKEQTALVKQIQTESQRIVNIISKIEKEIELMQEYRTALISEVVTGIIKIT